MAAYTGNQGPWFRDQADLTPYAGATQVRLRFRLETDISVVADGWYLDDIHIAEAPGTITLTSLTAEVNRIEIGWGQAADADFAAYRVYRSLTSNLNWKTVRLLDEISDRATTNYADITVSKKTHYYYRLMVLNSNELHTLSNEIDPLTPAGTDFPFLDDAEGGAALWVADAPWAISGETSASPTHAYSDSPGTNYAPSINQSLTLSVPLNLNGTTNPTLEYSHQYILEGGDSCNAEISTNAGVSWVLLESYTGESSDWLRGRHDLSAYTSSVLTLVRFRLTSDPGTVADGASDTRRMERHRQPE